LSNVDRVRSRLYCIGPSAVTRVVTEMDPDLGTMVEG